MDNIKIDKHVPLPPRIPGAKGYLGNLPLKTMEVGDSFLMEMSHDDERRLRALRVRVSRENRDSDGKRKYSVIKVEEGYRVFRIS